MSHDSVERFALLELDDGPRNTVPMADTGDDIVIEWTEGQDTKPDAKPLEPVVGLYKTAGSTFFNQDKCHTLADAIHAVPELEGTVAKEPLHLADGTLVPGSYATVRYMPDGTRQALGVVGDRYQVIQDSEAFAIMRPLLDDGIITELTAGAFRAKTWLYGQGQRFQADITAGDPIEARVLIGNSHDGSIPWSFGFPGNRVVCQNTFHMALSSKLSRLLKVRHTANAEQIVKQVQAATAMFGIEFVDSVEKFQYLAQTRCDESQLRDLVGYTFQPSRWADMEDEEQEQNRTYVQVLENYHSGRGASPGNLWGAYNAVTEYVTHQRHRESTPEQARFADLQWGNGANLTRRALDGAMRIAG